MAYKNRESALKGSYSGNLHHSKFDEYRDDKEIVLNALRFIDSEDSCCLSHVSKRLREDEEVVFKAVTVDPQGIRLATYRWRDNRDMVAKAISHFWWSIFWASDRLKCDKELVLMAFKGAIKDTTNQSYISKYHSHMYRWPENLKQMVDVSLLSDPEVVKNMSIINYRCFDYASYILKNDPKLILSIMKAHKDGHERNGVIDYSSEAIQQHFHDEDGKVANVGERFDKILSQLALVEELKTTLKDDDKVEKRIKI